MIQLPSECFTEQVCDRDPSSDPGRHHLRAFFRRFDIGGHVVQTQEFQHASAEDKDISPFETGNEILLDGSDLPPVGVTDLNFCIGDNGSDAHPMQSCQIFPGNLIHPLFPDQLPVLGISLEGLSSFFQEREEPVIFLLRKIPERVGGTDHIQIRLSTKAVPTGKSDQMLHQHVKRFLLRQPFFKATIFEYSSNRRNLSQFQAVGGHKKNL